MFTSVSNIVNIIFFLFFVFFFNLNHGNILKYIFVYRLEGISFLVAANDSQSLPELTRKRKKIYQNLE